jgi:hypothetical protein
MFYWGAFPQEKAPSSEGYETEKAPPLTESNKTARTIYWWIFLWAQPLYCKTEEEYHVLKALFIKFVQSNGVKDFFGSGFVDAIIKLVRENVKFHYSPLKIDLF